MIYALLSRDDGCDTINMILFDNIAIISDIFYHIYQASQISLGKERERHVELYWRKAKECIT